MEGNLKIVFTKIIFAIASFLFLSINSMASEYLIIDPIVAESKIIVPNKHLPDELMLVSKIILFNNLDKFWPNYMKVIENSEYSNTTSAVSFSTQWFNDNKIEDFDLFIFPVGDYPLNAEDDGGTRIIDKINEILDAGKKVFITGSAIFYAQSQLKDNDVETFLTNRMGCQYLGRQAILQNNTYKYFWAKGHPGDPVSISSYKFCNGKLTQSDGNNTVICETPQMGLVESIDLFRSKNQDIFMPVDHFIWEKEHSYDEKLVGIKIHEEEKNAKALLWSLPFQSFCSWNDWERSITYGIKWLLMTDINEDGPLLTFDIKKLDFGHVNIGEDKLREVNVMNIGNESLRITGVEFAEFSPPGTFKIISGNNFPINLNQNEQHQFLIRFTPKTEESFREYIDFLSNDPEMKSLELLGVGGAGTGSRIEVELADNFLDFGTVEPNKSLALDLYVKNTGNQDLWIRTIDLKHRNNEDKIFQIVQGGNYDTYITPGKSLLVKVRFSPRQEIIYTDSIMIWSNAINEEYTIISIKGQGGIVESVDEKELMPLGLLSFSVSPNPISDLAKMSFNVGGSTPKMLEITINDQLGKKVANVMKCLVSPGEYTEHFNTRMLSSGLYYLVITSDGQTTTLPVLISK